MRSNILGMLLFISICLMGMGQAQSISLNGQSLSNEGLPHDSSGGLIITAYYTEGTSIGAHFPDYKLPASVFVWNWYGGNTESFSNVGLHILTADESGKEKWYNSTWSFNLQSGRIAELVDKSLTTDKRRATLISLSYQSKEGSNLITDTWRLPDGASDDPRFDYNHLLVRIPEIDIDGNLIFDIGNKGKIAGYHSL